MVCGKNKYGESGQDFLYYCQDSATQIPKSNLGIWQHRHVLGARYDLADCMYVARATFSHSYESLGIER